jgi:inosine-uridine nucleoside N-ribohydrolase
MALSGRRLPLRGARPGGITVSGRWYWLDTDPGLDDALAILLAVQEVGEQLLGISTVQGNVEEAEASYNLRRLLSELERLELLPDGWSPQLPRGAAEPLTGEASRAYWVHGPDGLGGVRWEAVGRWADGSGPSAVEALLAAAREHGSSLQLICLGPLTNVALALRSEPELSRLVGGLTVMGGSLRAGGNETMAAEFNFLADPQAARAVLAAGFKNLRLVPIDGCLEARMTGADLKRLTALGTPAAGLAAELLRFWEPSIRERGQGLYDPVTWLLARHPELGRWEEVYVAVDVGGDVAHGASIADWRGRSGRPPNLRAATGVTHGGVMDWICELLG